MDHNIQDYNNDLKLHNFILRNIKNEINQTINLSKNICSIKSVEIFNEIIQFLHKNKKSIYDINEIINNFKDIPPNEINFYLKELDSIGKIICEDNKIYVLKEQKSHKTKKEFNPYSNKLKYSNKHSEIIDSILNFRSYQQNKIEKINNEITEILQYDTFKQKLLKNYFFSHSSNIVRYFCKYQTLDECESKHDKNYICRKVHLKKIIHKTTDPLLGDCSFLNACFYSNICKYIHYSTDSSYKRTKPIKNITPNLPKLTIDVPQVVLFPPQWIKCDIRFIDLNVLGKFQIIMADPPWDIHMELPYGTLADDEMMNLPVNQLQDDGFIFLWVTGRAMELGRECLERWGYKRCDELIWVKINQLQRLIRTGRTGHWLNHGKEHCLIGIKGNPKGFNRYLDCDVIVSEVRDTSHKPDEVYALIERLWPASRKIELFGRQHNTMPNWITLGNQLDGIMLHDPDLIIRFREKYPDGYNCDKN